ncbi:MAG: ROK family glucokinase [Propionicimonas sp.]|uniref:ROK family glucokinase n=1 Tax=Propionicimonas sp. TaxID=1955623 RepID=UPI003D1486E6
MTELTIGVDIGGTNILAGVVTPTGEIVATTRRATDPSDPTQIEEAVAEAVAELMASYEVAGVGVAAAGFVSADRRKLLFAPNIAWRDHPLADRLEALIGHPVVIENDANAAAWAEYRFGNGAGTTEMVMLTLGTGLGGAVISNGQLVRGAFGAAAELGHVKIVPDGHVCGCGQRGCWEAYASGTALARAAQRFAYEYIPAAKTMLDQAAGQPLTGAHVGAAARLGDPAALGLLAEFGRWLGYGMATLTAVTDPEVFVIGGGITTAAGDLILPTAREHYLANLSGRGYRGEPAILTAKLANNAGIIGAADSARTPAAQPVHA